MCASISASISVCKYYCRRMFSCACPCVFKSMPVCNSCIKATYTLRDCIFVPGCNSLWMLTNQRLSCRRGATLSRTWIKFSSYYWLVQALIRSLFSARRESRCLKLVAVRCCSDADQRVICVFACVFAEVV